MNRHFTQEDIQVANEHENVLNILSTMEMQPKSPMRYHYTPTAMDTENLTIRSDGEAVEPLELSCAAGGKTGRQGLTSLIYTNPMAQQSHC